MYSQILCKWITTEIHDGGGGARSQVDEFQSVYAIINEKSVKLFLRHIIYHFLLPAAVGYHFAIPFAVCVKRQRIAFYLIACDIEDDGLMVSVCKEVEFVVDGVNRVIDWVGNPKVGADSASMQQ